MVLIPQPVYQHVWSPRYIDAPIPRDENTDADGRSDDAREYYLADANFNITTLVDAAGDAVERYVYSPHGVLTVYDATWSSIRSDSSYAVEYTYTGGRLDPETGLCYYRHRMYAARLGRFASRDPVGYRGNGDVYAYVASAPATGSDALGLANLWCPVTWGISHPGQSWWSFCNPLSCENRAAIWGYTCGLCQGGLNIVNGTQDCVIGIGNLPSLGGNAACWAVGSDRRCPYIPSPDWSRNVCVYEPGWCHGASKFIGGQSAFTLCTLGTSQCSLLGEGSALGHVTGACDAELISECGVLEGGRSGACYALARPSLPQLDCLRALKFCWRPRIVPITGRACGAFRPIPVVGPISSWTRMCGGRVALCGGVCLRTGATMPGSTCLMLGHSLIDAGCGVGCQAISQSQTGVFSLQRCVETFVRQPQ